MMWQLTIKDGGAIQISNGNTGGDWSIGSFGVDMPVDIWTHLAVTYDGTNATLYINGQNPVSVSYVMGLGTEAVLSLGAAYQNDSAGTFFLGTVDDLRFYDRPLSAAEVVELAN